MISRRAFLQKSIAAFSLLSLPVTTQAKSFKKDIGLQLYTVRDYTSKDLRNTLKKLADIGYNNLEAAGYSEGKFYGLEPKVFRKMVEDFGMKIISSHSGISLENATQVIAAHDELGVDYLILPWIKIENPDTATFLKIAENLNKLGELCKKGKIKFGYHNHDFEFVNTDRGIGFDLLIENTDPKLVLFEADVYWMKKAGFDALDYFRKYPGRFELLHLKDMAASTAREDIEIGNGIIDFKPFFTSAKQSGMKYFFIEQDNCKIDSLESVAVSYANLRKLLD